MSEVVTLSLVESAAIEDAANEAIVDQAFVPLAPITDVPPEYEAGTTYALNALVKEGKQVYRSLEAGNKGHEPKGDADFAHWAPVATAMVSLQDPSFGATPAPLKQQAHNNKPPASSAANAAPAETVGVGEETLV
jgi:hypothetical protein